jgi:hypothetical protein
VCAAMRESTIGLPYVDEHAIRIPAARAMVWWALCDRVRASLFAGPLSPLATILGAEPRAGFEVADRVDAERLALVGRHRFARYQLTFELADTADGTTRLVARTHAAFPGVHGRLYRALVIGSGAHRVIVRRLLGSVRRLSVQMNERPAPPPTGG